MAPAPRAKAKFWILAPTIKSSKRAGSWYSYNGERIGQGKDNARLFLVERPALAREIENKVRAALGVRELPPALPGTPGAAAAGTVAGEEPAAKPAKAKAVAE